MARLDPATLIARARADRHGPSRRVAAIAAGIEAARHGTTTNPFHLTAEADLADAWSFGHRIASGPPHAPVNPAMARRAATAPGPDQTLFDL